MKTYGGRYLEAEELAALGCRDVGRDVRVHSTCLLVGLENLSFGSHIRVDAFSSLIAGDGQIRVGNHNHIAAYAFLSGAEGIELGDFVGISAGARKVPSRLAGMLWSAPGRSCCLVATSPRARRSAHSR